MDALSTADLLREVSHRPGPLPSQRWSFSMRWHDLLFAHWRVDPECLRGLLPAELTIDTCDGSAWVGVVPFWMSGVRRRGCPPLRRFPEINVRTYVRHGQRSGVWFFSLDATNRLAVAVARRFFHLPYHPARIRCTSGTREIHYSSRRVSGGPAVFEGRYSPTAAPEFAAPGSLEHFLVERYCLMTCDRRGLVRIGEIHHRPWPLQPAECRLEIQTMAKAAGIDLPAQDPLCHYAERLDVVAWMPRPSQRAEFEADPCA